LVPEGQRRLSGQEARLDPSGQRGLPILQDLAGLVSPDFQQGQVALGDPRDRLRPPGQPRQWHPPGPEGLRHPWALEDLPDRPRLPGQWHPPDQGGPRALGDLQGQQVLEGLASPRRQR
jgi:hypothetical protein